MNKKQYIAPLISLKEIVMENLLQTISHGGTGSSNNDVQGGQLNQSEHGTGDGGDMTAKHGTIDWDF